MNKSYRSQDESLNANKDTAQQSVSNKSAPIGVFDSGIGGLSVYAHLAQRLPTEKYLYYADTLHVPYGNRSSEDIEALTLNAVEWLYEQGCKLIIIACNSASAYGLTAARLRYPQLPIVGLVPALKPAVLSSISGHVAVLATKATLEGDLLNQVIREVALPNQTTVTKYFDPELVPWIEAGMPNQSETAKRLLRQLKLFAKENVDFLVLGCTHYPFFKPFLVREIAAQKLAIKIVDSGEAIAARVKDLLKSHQIAADSTELFETKNSLSQPLVFYATKYDDSLGELVKTLLGSQINIKHISVNH